MNRRDFLTTLTVTLGGGLSALPASDRTTAGVPALQDRIHGMLIGSMIGDALGGPIEFQPADKVAALPDPPKRWSEGEVIDDDALRALRRRLQLRSYATLRPEPESYGQWNQDSLPGTITDDSRHKLILFRALREADRHDRWPFSLAQYAQAHLDWPQQPLIRSNPAYRRLAVDWLGEWEQAARWVLGERDTTKALPPSRMWVGLPTCSGQMALPPLAALFPGKPLNAYRAAYQLGFFDNGFGKDLNAALTAGLAAALVLPAGELSSWNGVLDAMRRTDPFAYGKVPWVSRPLDRWLDLAVQLARDAALQPARLFAALDVEFRQTTKWEAQVPVVVAFACLELCGHDPLASLQLSVEWGHDTDSYAQVVGALTGARHGTDVFPEPLRAMVEERLRADFAVDLADEAAFLARLGAVERDWVELG